MSSVRKRHVKPKRKQPKHQPPTYPHLLPGEKVRILKCEHNEIEAGMIGSYVLRYEQGIGVDVSGRFRDANNKRPKEPVTMTIFVSDGDYEPIT